MARTQDSESPARSAGAILLGVVLVGAVLILSVWALKISGVPLVRREISGLQRQTVPPSATKVVTAPVSRELLSVRAEWEFESDWNWPTYRAWVTEQLQKTYKPGFSDESTLTFSQNFSGEMNQLQINKVRADSLLKVQVSFDRVVSLSD